MKIPCMYERDYGVLIRHIALTQNRGEPYSLCTKGLVIYLGGRVYREPTNCLFCMATLFRRDTQWHAVFENMWDVLSTSHGVAAPG